MLELYWNIMKILVYLSFDYLYWELLASKMKTRKTISHIFIETYNKLSSSNLHKLILLIWLVKGEAILSGVSRLRLPSEKMLL